MTEEQAMTTHPQERDIEKIVAYIEARVRPTICPTYSSTGEQSIEGRITQDDFDHLIGLVRRMRQTSDEGCSERIIAYPRPDGREGDQP